MKKTLILISMPFLMACIVSCGNNGKNEPKSADYTNPTYALLKSCYGGNVDEVRAGMEKDGFVEKVGRENFAAHIDEALEKAAETK